jgi:hypothetical protein
MRALVLDHFFQRDLAALRTALEPGEELRTIDYSVLREEALRYFPQEVTVGLEPYARPDLAHARETYAAQLARMVEDEFAAWPFDIFVLPSDFYFYVRELPAACAPLGVPVVIVQKETTRAPQNMEVLSGTAARDAPPIAEAMSVCSERYREFALRCGWDPERVVVSGQPRFDVYGAEPPPRREGPPRCVFFSYRTFAYHPRTYEGTLTYAWETLHRQTEEGLFELARRGWEITIKPHPQQDWAADRARIDAALEPELRERVHLADPAEDARPLVLDADAVVGFQSTALIESLGAGKPVIYTWWDPEAERVSDSLVPFHEWDDVLAVVRRPEDLADTVEERHRLGLSAVDTERARALVTEWIGPMDGGAAQRAMAMVRRHARQGIAARTPEQTARREELATRGRAARRARREARRVRRFANGVARHRLGRLRR